MGGWHRRLALLLAAAAYAGVLSGCGGAGEKHDRQAVRAVALKFVETVRQGDADKQCLYLTEPARKYQGCGNAGEDIGPFLRLSVESVKDPRRDIRILAIGSRVAKVGLPDWRLKSCCERSLRGSGGKRVPMILKLKKTGSGDWKVYNFGGSANLPY
jgi:hypothetical protein